MINIPLPLLYAVFILSVFMYLIGCVIAFIVSDDQKSTLRRLWWAVTWPLDIVLLFFAIARGRYSNDH